MMPSLLLALDPDFAGLQRQHINRRQGAMVRPLPVCAGAAHQVPRAASVVPTPQGVLCSRYVVTYCSDATSAVIPYLLSANVLQVRKQTILERSVLHALNGVGQMSVETACSAIDFVRRTGETVEAVLVVCWPVDAKNQLEVHTQEHLSSGNLYSTCCTVRGSILPGLASTRAFSRAKLAHQASHTHTVLNFANDGVTSDQQSSPPRRPTLRI